MPPTKKTQPIRTEPHRVRGEQVIVRMTKEERSVTDSVAAHHGLSRSDLVRMLVLREARKENIPIPSPGTRR